MNIVNINKIRTYFRLNNCLIIYFLNKLSI